MKKLRFTVGNKILGSFLSLVVIFALYAAYSIVTLNKSNNILQETSQVVQPSLKGINDFTLLVTRSKMLVTNWVYLRSNIDDKEALKALHDIEYPELKDRLTSLKTLWGSTAETELMDSIFLNFETLIKVEKNIMEQLQTFEDYEDFMKKSETEEAIEGNVQTATALLLNQLERLGKTKASQTAAAEQNLLSSIDRLRNTILGIGIVIIAISLIGGFFVARSITKPIKHLRKIIVKLALGELPEKKETTKANYQDEVTEMAEAVDNLVTGLQSTSHFAENIGNGKYDSDYAPLSENDVLGNALIGMRDNLKKVSEEDKRRNWATEGLARFGEILRNNNDNISKLSDDIISNLVKYLNANQGGIFIIEDQDVEEAHLSLAACYAWDKKKYIEQKIYKGDGLTGQAWLENDTIYLTEVPENYIRISSGLGEANPRSILIVPLKINEAVFGVIEIASFSEFQKFEVEFIEKIAESIASTISSVKINERTQRLLEESTELTEQMRSQEEEMRQNMEELKATQEEMQRTQRDREDKEKIINSTNMMFELDNSFNVIGINDLVKTALNFETHDLFGKSVDNVIASKETFAQIKSILSSGKPWSGVLELKGKLADRVKVKVSAGKAYDSSNGNNKYLIFASDITHVSV